jgi:hypothetical protein
MKSRQLLTLCLLAFLLLFTADIASAQSAKERVTALKANLAASKATLRQYEWVQTTTVSKGGDVKSTKQENCYYGDDGSLQKVMLSDEQAQQRQGLLFRRLKERKKEELTDYMKSAVALVKSYVPPTASLIQAAKDNGNVSLTPLGSGRAAIVFQNYLKQGDTYTVEVNLRDNSPVALKVSTYVNDPSDVVKLIAVMGQLDNGTTYPAAVTLNAESKGITVNVHNSGYRRRN